jgi:hypothetical protein
MLLMGIENDRGEGRTTHFAVAHDPCQLVWPVNQIRMASFDLWIAGAMGE